MELALGIYQLGVQTRQHVWSTGTKPAIHRRRDQRRTPAVLCNLHL